MNEIDELEICKNRLFHLEKLNNQKSDGLRLSAVDLICIQSCRFDEVYNEIEKSQSISDFCNKHECGEDE